jgi:hypothetical protein
MFVPSQFWQKGHFDEVVNTSVIGGNRAEFVGQLTFYDNVHFHFYVRIVG